MFIAIFVAVVTHLGFLVVVQADISYQECFSHAYCSENDVAVRGDFTIDNPEACAQACYDIDDELKYFDITSNGECWCGLTCSSKVDFPTTGFAMNGGWCPTQSPSNAPTVTPTEAPSDSPTELPSIAPSVAPSESPTDSPTQTPSFAPTKDHSLCFADMYCSGDTTRLRGIFPTPDICYSSCYERDHNFKYFDFTPSQQCWCGYTCNQITPFGTLGYRMGGGICPELTSTPSSSPTHDPAESLVVVNPLSIIVGDAEDLGLTQASFSGMAWVLITVDDVSSAGIFSGRDVFDTDHELHWVVRYGKPHFGLFSDDVTGVTKLALNTWYHIAFVYDMNDRSLTIYEWCC